MVNQLLLIDDSGQLYHQIVILINHMIAQDPLGMCHQWFDFVISSLSPQSTINHPQFDLKWLMVDVNP